MALHCPWTPEVIRVQSDDFGGLNWALLKRPKSEGPKVVGYIEKIAVRATSLGPKIAAGSSPAGATKMPPNYERTVTMLAP
jgi:hypothetical protein